MVFERRQGNDLRKLSGTLHPHTEAARDKARCKGKRAGGWGWDERQHKQIPAQQRGFPLEGGRGEDEFNALL